MSTKSPHRKSLLKRLPRKRVKISLRARKAFLTKAILKQRDTGMQISFGRNNNLNGSNIVIGNFTKSRIYQKNQTIIAADETFNVGGLSSPYLGLGAYAREAHHLYAGRENRVTETVQILTEVGVQPSLLFVVGASGSGKSSFVQAGVLPTLEQKYSDLNYLVRSAVITPSTYPRSKIQCDILQKWLMRWQSDWTIARCFQTLAEQTDQSTINIIMIDQFEEVWNQSDPEQSRELLAALQTLPSYDQWRTQIIVTLRADFVYELYPYQHLYDLATKPPVVELRPMSSDDIRRAINQPLHIKHSGKRWEPLLLNDLVRVAADQIDALPLLQVMLEQQWQTGRLWIDEPKYFDRAISDHADAIYATYSTEQQNQIMRLLTDLVKVGDEPRQDVRQRRSVAALCDGNPEYEQLITNLINARLLSGDQEMRGEQSVPVITIIHESLLMNWPRLQDAIKTNRTLLHQRTRLTQNLQEWEANEQSDDYVLVGVRLAEAEALVQADDIAIQSNEAKELVWRSVAIRERDLRNKVRNQRFTIGLLTVLIIIGVIIAVQQVQQQQDRVAAAQLPISIRSPVITIPAGQAKLDIKSKPLMNQFVIEQFEVSQQQYRTCVEARECVAPDNKILFDNNNYDNHPMVYITPVDAWKYCLWVKRRLPTSAEWERAVRGHEGRSWPWGDTSPTLNLAHMPIVSTQLTDTLPVNALLGTTPLPEGPIYHLVGNVSEFVVVVSSNCDTSANCHLNWDGKSDQIALTGGDYKSSINQVWRRLPTSLSTNDQEHGFRCASSEE